MVKHDGAETRKLRMQEIASDILRRLAVKPSLPLPDVIAALQYSTGLTRPKLMEYLKIMEGMGMFDIDVQKDLICKPMVFNPNLFGAQGKETSQ